MAQDTLTSENVETRKASRKTKKVEIPQVKSFHGYTPSSEASEILSKAVGRHIAQTTVNNAVYAGKIEAIQIGGMFLLKEEGEKSVAAYAPVLKDEEKNKELRKTQKSKQDEAKEQAKLFKQFIDIKIKHDLDISDFATYLEYVETCTENGEKVTEEEFINFLKH